MSRTDLVTPAGDGALADPPGPAGDGPTRDVPAEAPTGAVEAESITEARRTEVAGSLAGPPRGTPAAPALESVAADSTPAPGPPLRADRTEPQRRDAPVGAEPPIGSEPGKREVVARPRPPVPPSLPSDRPSTGETGEIGEIGETGEAVRRPAREPASEPVGEVARVEARPALASTVPARGGEDDLPELRSRRTGSRSRPDRRPEPEPPRVHIGQVEVVVAAPADPRPAPKPAARTAGQASRLYLRRL